jgi:polysaccharide deacetylase family protein (PEP-CTERM system associated)
MTHQEFHEDTIRAKQAIEDAAGAPVRGYRAPSFSITRDSQWAYEILIEAGFIYDSSIFPVRHPDYGMPRLPRTPFLVKTPSGTIIEFPVSTLAVGDRRAPFAGGAYLRLLPYTYTRWGIYFLNHAEQHSACIYVHPWELDPEQPRLNVGLTSMLRHYTGLGTLEKKLRLLLRDFEFATLESLLPPIKDLDFVLHTERFRSAMVPIDAFSQNLETTKSTSSGTQGQSLA